MSSRAESSSSVIRTKSFKDRYAPSACDIQLSGPDSNAIRGGPSQLIALHKAAEERSGTNSPVPCSRTVSRSSSRMGAMLAAARDRGPQTASNSGRILRGSKSANDRGSGSPLIRDSTTSSIHGSDNLSAYQDEYMQHNANALEARAAEAEALILQKLEEIRKIREQVNTMVMHQFQEGVSPGQAAALEQNRAANDASLLLGLSSGLSATNSQLKGLGLQPLDPVTMQAFSKAAQSTNHLPSSSSDPFVPPAYACGAFPAVPGSVDSPNHRPTPSSGLYRASTNSPALQAGKDQGSHPYSGVMGRKSASPAPSATGASLLKSALARSVLNSQQGQSSRLPSATGSVASSKSTRFNGRRSPTVVCFDDQPVTSVPVSPVAAHRTGPASDRASQGQPRRGVAAGTASSAMYDGGPEGTYVAGSGGGKRSRQQSNAKLSGFAGSEVKRHSSRVAGAGSFHNRVAPFNSNDHQISHSQSANPKRLGLLGRLSRWLRGVTRRGKCAADVPQNPGQGQGQGQGLPVVNKYGYRNKQPSMAGSLAEEGSFAGSGNWKRRVFRVISTSQAGLPGYY